MMHPKFLGLVVLAMAITMADGLYRIAEKTWLSIGVFLDRRLHGAVADSAQGRSAYNADESTKKGPGFD